MTLLGVPKKKREKKTYYGQYTSILKLSPVYLSTQFFLKLDIFVRLFDFFLNLLEGLSNLPSN